MDSSLEGQYANEDASKLVDLASKCLQFEARDRPNIKYLLSSVGPLQKQKEVSSFNHLLDYYYSVFPTVAQFTYFVNHNLGGVTCVDGHYKNRVSLTNYSFSTWKGLCRNGPYSSTWYIAQNRLQRRWRCRKWGNIQSMYHYSFMMHLLLGHHLCGELSFVMICVDLAFL